MTPDRGSRRQGGTRRTFPDAASRTATGNDRGSITATRRHAPPAAASTGAGQEAGRTIFASRGSAPTTYSTEVQQRPLTAASEHDRQHTELAGATAKRPAAPLVRDEEAAGSNPATPTRITRSEGCLPTPRQKLGSCWETFGRRSWHRTVASDRPRWSLVWLPAGGSAESGPGRRLRHRRLHGFPPRPVVPGHRMYRRRKRGAAAAPRARAMVAAEASACVLTTGWPHGIFRSPLRR
jgi:hypothetical protein